VSLLFGLLVSTVRTLVAILVGYHGVLAPNAPLRAAATAYGRDAADDPSASAEVAAAPAAPAPNARFPARYPLPPSDGAMKR
jgi:hypothetical protein